MGYVSILITLAVLFSWLTVRWAFIPLGLVRPSYWLTLFGDLSFRPDREGGATVAAAWALLRARRASADDALWVHAKVEAAPQLRGGGVLASGLLAAWQGERADARALVESVAWMSDAAVPRVVRGIALRWLHADMAERAEWRALADETDETFLVLAARRIVGHPLAPGDDTLRASFLREGRWWATRALYDRALVAKVHDDGVTPPPTPAPPSRLPVVEGGGLPRALTLHAALVTLPQTKLHAGDIGIVVRAWDDALGDETLQTQVNQRALELRASVAARALSDLRATVSADLARLAVGAKVGLSELAGDGEIARKVSWQLRDVLLAEVEALLEANRVRVEATGAASKIDEWREFVAIRRAYARAAAMGGAELRRLAFAGLHRPMCAWAVWLFNERKERAIGNAMFRWILDEAVLVGDTRTEELQRKNVACGV